MTSTQSRIRPHPEFLRSPAGLIYTLHFAAQAPLKGGVLWFQPFAEEANCARRHLVAAARECALAGYESLIVDLPGTGESDGELEMMRWADWHASALLALSQFKTRLNGQGVWLAGIRFGALLAVALATNSEATAIDGLLLWQPVLQGRQQVDGFLRLQLAAEWSEMPGRRADAVLSGLRSQLAAGQVLEIGGYHLSADLAADMTQLHLDVSGAPCRRIACVEFRSAQTEGDEPPEHSSALSRQLSQWREQGLHVSSAVVEAVPFWMHHESPLTSGAGVCSVRLMESIS